MTDYIELIKRVTSLRILLLVVAQSLLKNLLIESVTTKLVGAQKNILTPDSNGDPTTGDQGSLSISYSSLDSPGCPSNRTEASEKGRQCSRKCRQDVPCENIRKHCLCDGICGWSCLKPDLNCQELIKPENGFFYPKSTVLNTKVRYECEPGFYLFGPRERICQGDEEWSDFAPECLAEPACKVPPKVFHARNPNEGYYRVGDKVIYSCYSGYDSYGSNETVCTFLTDQNSTGWIWSGPEFKCIPKSCGDPGLLENGRRHGDSFIVASTVVFSCNEGWQMLGQARRYCQSDGQWSGQQPQCEPVICDPTDHLENGRINYLNPLIFNSSVEYACDEGFRLIGPKYRLCGPDKKLIGDLPHCKEIDCGDFGPLYNGYMRGFNSKIGDKKFFTCQEGMKFVGESNETTCLDTGQWSHPKPLCLGRCLVPEIENANYIGVPISTVFGGNATANSTTIPPLLSSSNPKNNTNGITVTSLQVKPGMLVNHGQFLDIRCDSNFEPDEQVDQDSVIGPPACDNSTWTYLPRCVPAKCRYLPIGPKNSMILVTSTDHGSKARIRCLDGYKLEGKGFAICNHGNWTTIESECQEIYCGFPGTIEHGRVLLLGHMGMYDYRPYIKKVSNNRQIAYECEPGYRANDGAPSGATCLDGQWRPEQLPQCAPTIRLQDQDQGITDSEGNIYDFGGSFYVAVDNFTFGNPTKYLKLDVNKAGGPHQWDEAIRKSAEKFRRTCHNIVTNNCHHHVADTLNNMCYDGKSSYNQLDIFLMMTFKSNYCGLWGFLKQWFLVIMILILVLVLFASGSL